MQFKKILVAVDFSENSDYAFDYALSLARERNSFLQVVHVINQPMDLRGLYMPELSFSDLEKEMEKSARKMLDEFCVTKLKDYPNYEIQVLVGTPYIEIVKEAQRINASVIVVGTHGRTGIEHVLFGSTAERVVRSSTCPVLTVRFASE